jgi:hypothetical protein
LGDIDHDKQDEPRLGHSRSTPACDVVNRLHFCLIALHILRLDLAFAVVRISTYGPDLSIGPDFQLNGVKWSWRRSIKHIPRFRVERAVVTRTFESLMRALKIDRTRKMSAFLTKGV